MLYRVSLSGSYKLTGEPLSGEFLVQAEDEFQALERVQEDYDFYGVAIEDLSARPTGRRSAWLSGVELPERTGGT